MGTSRPRVIRIGASSVGKQIEICIPQVVRHAHRDEHCGVCLLVFRSGGRARLDLGANEIGDEGAEAIMAALGAGLPTSRLHTLRLARNGVSARGARAIAEHCATGTGQHEGSTRGSAPGSSALTLNAVKLKPWPTGNSGEIGVRSPFSYHEPHAYWYSEEGDPDPGILTPCPQAGP